MKTQFDNISSLCDKLGVEIVMWAETHVTLNTNTKLNCSCQNTTWADANSNICPVCSGQPGALPEVNSEAVKKSIKFGKAIDAEIADVLFFDRKHYEYPDLPSGFQRTQFEKPIVLWWEVKCFTRDGKPVSVHISHAHLEEDAGKLTHDSQKNKTYIDYNRAGRPLIEVVTNPDIHSIPALMAYLEQLQRLVRGIGISQADMQKWQFKSDISISLRKRWTTNLNERTEIKNLNSFKFAKQAVATEIMQQLEYWQEHSKAKTDQVTVLFDENKQELKVMRKKEWEWDYRFMREPNIPNIDIVDFAKNVDIDIAYLPYEVEQQLLDAWFSLADATYFSGDMLKSKVLFDINENVWNMSLVAKTLMNVMKVDEYENVPTKEFTSILQEYLANDDFSGWLLKHILRAILQDPNFDYKKHLAEQAIDIWDLDNEIKKIIDQEATIADEIKAWNTWKAGVLVWKLMQSWLKWKVSGAELKKKILVFLWVEEKEDPNTTKRKRSKDMIDVDALNKKDVKFWDEYRTHELDQIDESFIGKEVKISGWVHSVRDHGDLLFIDLRQGWHLFQVRVSRDSFDEIDEIAKIKDESVIMIKGPIVKRSEDQYYENKWKDLYNQERTWTIEIDTKEFYVLSHSQQIPFEITKSHSVSEEIRMKYRYLDLRNNKIRDNLIKRSKVVTAIRNYFDKWDFVEVETPLLTKGSDEWSREFIVPSRLTPWSFYVLPQAPQQFKQLLMTSWIDKYFQIARCFRDEDPKWDRQPEFTQVDVEMAYINEETIVKNISDLLLQLVSKIYPEKKLQSKKIPNISYKDAMDRYGCDKPDIRFELKLQEITDVLRNTKFNVFRQPIEDWGIVKCIKVDGTMVKDIVKDKSFLSKKYKEQELIKLVKEHWLGGLAYLEVQWDTLHPFMNVDKLGEDVCRDIVNKVWAEDGDTIFFAADKEEIVNDALDAVRRTLGKKLKLYDEDDLAFCWIRDFPMFEKTEEDKWKFTHNPFSMPKLEHVDRLLKWENIEKIQAQQYDIVLNGHEIGGGSIRAHIPHVLKATYKIMWYSEEDIKHSVGHMLDAFSYGTPPHGWLALWLDRLLMILQKQKSIREVIPFPKTGDSRDILMEAPSPLSNETLSIANIQLKK